MQTVRESVSCMRVCLENEIINYSPKCKNNLRHGILTRIRDILEEIMAGDRETFDRGLFDLHAALSLMIREVDLDIPERCPLPY